MAIGNVKIGFVFAAILIYYVKLLNKNNLPPMFAPFISEVIAT